MIRDFRKLLKMGIFSKNRYHYRNLRKKGFIIGPHTYVGKRNGLCSPDKIKIGDYCCISNSAYFAPSTHPTNWLSVHPFQYRKKLDSKLYGEFPSNPNPILYDESPKSIEIGNDVWIADHTFIMGGVKIGDGAIIGMNAVVTKDVPPYAIAVGVPAHVVKYRFEPEIIEKLLQLKWWELPYEFILTLPFNSINDCIKKLEDYRNQNALVNENK